MRKYRPSNGTEGEHFASDFCKQCINERWIHFMEENNPNDQCQIWSDVLIYELKDPNYPKEWIYNNENKPVCTAFVKWDWGNGDDRNEPPPKPEPPSNDPNQLLMPFDIWELLGITDEIIVTKGAIIERKILEK